MVWILPDSRCCPSCGYRERILITRSREGYRLSCGWCAHLGDVMDPQRAFFKAWGPPPYDTGAILNLEGVPFWQGDTLVEAVPISVILSPASALVVERK